MGRVRATATSARGSIAVLTITLVILLPTCRQPDDPAPPPPPVAGEVTATVASFRVMTSPDGVETVEQIAVSNHLVRFPDEPERWRLFDIANGTVTIVDEIDRKVERRTFDEVLGELRAASRSNQRLPTASIRKTGDLESVAGFEAERYLVEIEGAWERELWISRRPLFHSDLFLLRLATDPIPAGNLPALRRMISTLDDLEGYPVRDRSRMELDGKEYSVERTLIAVADQQVPASWFEIPRWARAALTGSPGGRPPDVSPRSDRNTREAESPPSG